MNRLRREGRIHGGLRDAIAKHSIGTRGSLTWVTAWGKGVASYHFERDEEGEGFVFRLVYEIGEEHVDLSIRLQTTRQSRGGLRWWLTCPLQYPAGPCGRRVAKLYLPPGGDYFGCRACHDLTYASCQESRSGDSFFRRMALGSGQSFSKVKGYFMGMKRFERRFSEARQLR